MTSRKFNTVTIFIIVIVVGGVYLATIREGHNWSGDFGMYIHHAKNIPEGIDYKDTGRRLWVCRGLRFSIHTNQGLQFTSEEFTGRLEGERLRISMDGRGRVYDEIEEVLEIFKSAWITTGPKTKKFQLEKRIYFINNSYPNLHLVGEKLGIRSLGLKSLNKILASSNLIPSEV